MDTPITISSASSVHKSDFMQLNYNSHGNNVQSVVSLQSTNFEEVPVSWNSSDNACTRTDSNTTLTNIEKVSNWINSIEEPKCEPIIVDLVDDVKDDSFTENTKAVTINDEFNAETKSVILFRCDFKKSIPGKHYSSPNSLNRSAHLGRYLKNEEKEKPIPSYSNSSSSSSKDKITSPNSIIRKTSQKRLALHNELNKISADNQSSQMSDTKSDGSSDVYEVPLSPESRKKELYRYLQLMNPADKKERFILQNRRSTRVRNLTAMQEKKNKVDSTIIPKGDSEQSTKDTDKCLTLKSFKELNIMIEKTKFNHDSLKDKTSDTETERDMFCFPFPSSQLIQNVQDFDNTMSKLIPTYKRICRIKKLKLNCKVQLTKSALKDKSNFVKTISNVEHKTHEHNNTQKERTTLTPNKQKNNELVKGSKFHEVHRKRHKKPSLKRTKSLRSNRTLKNISLKKLIGKKEKELLSIKNIRKKCTQETKDKKPPLPIKKNTNIEVNSSIEANNLRCEIITVSNNSEDNHVDMENFMDDMTDFNNLSEEHKKCLIESRILSTKPTPNVTTLNNTEESVHSFDCNKRDGAADKVCEVYKTSPFAIDKQEMYKKPLCDTHRLKLEQTDANCTEHKTERKSAIEVLALKDYDAQSYFIEIEDDELEMKSEEGGDNKSITSEHPVTNGLPLQEHNYAGSPSDDEEEEVLVIPTKTLPVRGYKEINPYCMFKKNEKFEVLPYKKTVEVKSLHKSLQYIKKKNGNSLEDQSFTREEETDNSSKQKTRKQSHYISINKQNGAVLKAFYIDFNLIVCQENIVSFWMQTPLGNVLGSQNMWIPRGETQRLVLNGKCMQKESMEMVIAMETHVAYIELWTKEHKSDIRKGPVADVFATVYFWKQRQTGLDKKVLQLENIKGFADDVQYSVMKGISKIIVSWYSAHEDGTSKKTYIHAYQLAADFQTVANIYNIEPVDHYVSSLHIIEECDNLIMGCGENKVTLWNVDYGYNVATIVLSEIKSPLSTSWVKCDRGFLFALQQCVDRELRLIAINGLNHSWKKLASYIPPEGFDRLRGVCIENGLLLSFYDQGILCWKAETGEPIEEISIESDIIPSGKYVIIIEEEQILVKHAMTHLMSVSVDET